MPIFEMSMINSQKEQSVILYTDRTHSQAEVWYTTPMLKAIIFDMNGVIIDDESLHEEAYRRTFKPLGIGLTAEEFKRDGIGRSDLAFAQTHVANKNRTDINLDKLVVKKIDLYFDLLKNVFPIVPGVVETVKALGKRYRLALTTGSPKVEVNLILQRLNITDDFEVVVTADDFTRSKPDPESYLLTLKKLGLKPDECVAIEDSLPGIKSVKAAGMKCIAISTTHTHGELREADTVIDSLRQLELVLSRISPH
ncbi:MAG: HAD family phosphatase [Parcubacteria group bacterium]